MDFSLTKELFAKAVVFKATLCEIRRPSAYGELCQEQSGPSIKRSKNKTQAQLCVNLFPVVKLLCLSVWTHLKEQPRVS